MTGSIVLRTSIKIAAAVAACLISANAFAFDDNRQGFFVGVGAGFHGISVKDELNGSTISDSAGGLATSFKLGGGISEQFSLYYIRNVSWFKTQDTFGDSLTFLGGISGVGGTYYLQPSSPSLYVMGAVGLGDRAAPFESIEADLGGAFMLGAGYELAKHKMVELNALFVDVERSDSEDSSLNSIQLTFNYLWY